MIELAIRKPVAVAVGVLIVLLFGGLSLLRIPVQLTPDLVKPQVTIDTIWPGASPHEIESEIVDEQEQQLKGVEGVERITSDSFDSLGRIVLEFPPGTDMDAAVIKVSNRLEQVPEYPEDAEKPVILLTNKTDNAMAWFMLRRLPGNDTAIDEYFRLCDDFIKPRFERVPGVGTANVFGGREKELQVIVDADALAVRGITIAQVLAALDRENTNLSAGDFSEGKRKYKVRTVGEYERPEDVEKVVLHTRGGGRVYLRDVAEVRVGLKKLEGFVRQSGHETLAVNCVRRVGANVIETMESIREVVRELNDDHLRDLGLELSQVYDETEYIGSSIDNVLRNLVVGSLLAIFVLFVFLRSPASTFIVAVAIPISVVGSFVLMYVFGRTINVISLAGMSFASGMVVDNAIVSLENIYRLRQEGKRPFEAALEGARGVWGAILASTLTTIAVFVPILFVEERAAQLFRDIAIAVSCSVGLSLLVSVTVIPTLGAKLLRRQATSASRRARSGFGVFERLRDGIVAAVGIATRGVVRRIAVVVLLTATSVGLAWAFLPEAEYLPIGNRNLAIAVLLPPPGYNLDEMSRMGHVIEGKLEPHLHDRSTAYASGVAEAASPPTSPEPASGSTSESAGSTPPAVPEGSARISHVFFVARGASVFLGASCAEPERAGELVPILQGAMSDLPGMISVVQQASLFERGIASGRRVDIEITGPELEQLVAIGGRIFGQVMALFPRDGGHQARPIPSLDLQTPEVRVLPDRERARDLGLDARGIGIAVNVMVDGAKASEYMHEGREVDLSVLSKGRGERDWRTQDVAAIPIAASNGRIVPLGSVADVRVTRGPEQIQHIERDRAITIRIVPAKDMPIERVVETVRREVLDPLLASGAVRPPYDVRLAGTVDDLYRAFTAFRFNFALAVIITYLLLAALFESFVYPLVILFSVPLAAVGGVVCLGVVSSLVPNVRLDILTKLGFVILVGVVVNNAILIVYQSLREIRRGGNGISIHAAVVEAVRSRVRPIFMTTLTSGFGMAPLILFPGAGSELYRGLGCVVVGGLVVSTAFTLFLVPALLALVLEVRARIGGSAA